MDSSKKSMPYKRTCFSLLPSQFLSLVLEREIQSSLLFWIVFPCILRTLHCSSQAPGPGPGGTERAVSGSSWFKKIALLRFGILFRCVPSSQCTPKLASNESRLFPALLEFQDGQTYSKELEDEHVPYSWEYEVMWFLKTGKLNSKNTVYFVPV